MKLSDKIAFDSAALLIMHLKKSRPFLELALVNFEIIIPQPSVYEYLLMKGLIGGNVRAEMEILKEIYHIVPTSDEIMVKSAQIHHLLLKKGIQMNTNDIITGVTAIEENALLVTDDPERYRPLLKYGLNLISLERFFKELGQLAKDLSSEKAQPKFLENAKFEGMSK